MKYSLNKSIGICGYITLEKTDKIEAKDSSLNLIHSKNDNTVNSSISPKLSQNNHIISYSGGAIIPIKT
jgi:hypothetical protein